MSSRNGKHAFRQSTNPYEYTRQHEELVKRAKDSYMGSEELKRRMAEQIEFEKNLQRQHKMSEATEYFKAMQMQLEGQRLSSKAPGGRGTLLMGKANLLQARMMFIDWLKPMIVTVLLVLLIVGAGLPAVFAILGSLNLWMLLGLIIIGIFIFKYR